MQKTRGIFAEHFKDTFVWHVLIDIGKFFATQGQHIAQALPGVIKILQGITAGERASTTPVDDIIGHESFEAAAQRSDEVQRWRHKCLFTQLGASHGFFVELREEVVQLRKKGCKIAKQTGWFVLTVTEELAHAALAQYRGVVVASTSVQVMRFVDDQYTIVVWRILKEAPQVGAGIEDIVVVTNNDVRFDGHVQR